MKSFAIIATCLTAGIAATFLPFVDVSKVAGDLITLFAILAGLLAQLMALMAVMLEPGRLASDSVRSVGKEIEQLQSLNIWLFGIYGAAVLVLVAIRILESHAMFVSQLLVPPIVSLQAYGWTGITMGCSVSFIAGVLTALAAIRTFRTLLAIRSLQRVRTEVQARDAEARERAARERSADRLTPVPDSGGASYGRFVDAPRVQPRSKRTGQGK